MSPLPKSQNSTCRAIYCPVALSSTVKGQLCRWSSDARSLKCTWHVFYMTPYLYLSLVPNNTIRPAVHSKLCYVDSCLTTGLPKCNKYETPGWCNEELSQNTAGNVIIVRWKSASGSRFTDRGVSQTRPV